MRSIADALLSTLQPERAPGAALVRRAMRTDGKTAAAGRAAAFVLRCSDQASDTFRSHSKLPSYTQGCRFTR